MLSKIAQSYSVSNNETVVIGDSYESDIVLDPFAGSGTTLLMARKLNRRYIGIDINSDYVASMKQALDQEVL